MSITTLIMLIIVAQQDQTLATFSSDSAPGVGLAKFPGRSKLDYTWPSKYSAEISGDILLGGLMMIHSRSESSVCGPIMAQGGVQALETMLYTIDRINEEGIMNLSLGAHALDDCDQDTHGLEMAVDFIKGASSILSCTRKQTYILEKHSAYSGQYWKSLRAL